MSTPIHLSNNQTGNNKVNVQTGGRKPAVKTSSVTLTNKQTGNGNINIQAGGHVSSAHGYTSVNSVPVQSNPSTASTTAASTNNNNSNLSIQSTGDVNVSLS
jgi:hypothetical protein